MVIFGPVRAPNTPAAMADRIPDRGITQVIAAVSGWEPRHGPIRVHVPDAGPANGRALVNGADETFITGTAVLAVSGTDQTSPRAGAFNLQLEGVLGVAPIGRSKPFAVVAIMEKMSTSRDDVVAAPAGVSLFARMSKQTDGAEGLGSLKEMEYLEHLVVVDEVGAMVGFGLGDHGDSVLADRDQLDEHGTPNEYLRQLGRRRSSRCTR